MKHLNVQHSIQWQVQPLHVACWAFASVCLYVALPPVRLVGVRCAGTLQDQYQELVHLQQDGISAAFIKEPSEQPVLFLSQGLPVLF